MTDVVAVDVEGVGIAVAPLVTVGRAEQQQHRAAGRHRRACVVEVRGQIAGDVRAGRFEAQSLVDRPRQQRAVLGDLAPLPGVLGEHLGQPTDQTAGRLVTGPRHHLGVVQHLRTGELAVHTVLVGELDVEQRRHQIVGRIGGAPVDVVGVDSTVGDPARIGDLNRRAGPGAQVGVIGIAHRDLLGLGDAQQHADDPHRHHRGQFGDDVEPVGPDQRVEAGDAVGPDPVFDLGHPARGEHPRHQPPQHRVLGRVLEHHHAIGHVEVGFDQFEDVAAAIGEDLPVQQRAFDVGVPGQRPEVVARVVVQRRLVAQPSVDRIGIGDDRGVVGVVMNPGFGAGARRHPVDGSRARTVGSSGGGRRARLGRIR